MNLDQIGVVLTLKMKIVLTKTSFNKEKTMDHIKKVLTWAKANKQKSVIIVVAVIAIIALLN